MTPIDKVMETLKEKFDSEYKQYCDEENTGTKRQLFLQLQREWHTDKIKSNIDRYDEYDDAEQKVMYNYFKKCTQNINAAKEKAEKEKAAKAEKAAKEKAAKEKAEKAEKAAKAAKEKAEQNKVRLECIFNEFVNDILNQVKRSVQYRQEKIVEVLQLHKQGTPITKDMQETFRDILANLATAEKEKAAKEKAAKAAKAGQANPNGMPIFNRKAVPRPTCVQIPNPEGASNVSAPPVKTATRHPVGKGHKGPSEYQGGYNVR